MIALPKANARRNVNAVDYFRASIARQLIRERKAAGFGQSELADRAGVRQETISRLESGKQTVTARVMGRIEKVLRSQRSGTGALHSKDKRMTRKRADS